MSSYLGATPADRRVLEALQGKTLVATLCGHGHARTLSAWGGAPQVMGGAVCYAWHGHLPFPPQPHGYVLYRLEGSRLEHVFLDWAEERSFDVALPAFTDVLAGKQAIRGTVSDPLGEVTGVECAVAGRHAKAAVRRSGSLAQEFEAELDLSPLADGVYDLLLTARAGGRRWSKRQPLLVVNGRPAPFQATGPATLEFRASGMAGPGTEVLLNGEVLAPIAAGVGPSEAIAVPVPAERLRRLNAIAFRAAPRENGHDRLTVHSVWLRYGGRRCRDVRFPPLAPRVARARQGAGPPEVTAHIDLTYNDTRVVQP